MAMLGVAVMAFGVSSYVLFWYFVMGAISFVVYYLDKAAAQNDNQRTPEKILHLIDVFGGWVGASFINF